MDTELTAGIGWSSLPGEVVGDLPAGWYLRTETDVPRTRQRLEVTNVVTSCGGIQERRCDVQLFVDGATKAQYDRWWRARPEPKFAKDVRCSPAMDVVVLATGRRQLPRRRVALSEELSGALCGVDPQPEMFGCVGHQAQHS